MSNRLAGMARKVARKRARGLPLAEVDRGPASGDPWRAIAEEARQKTVEVTSSGIVVTTYTDSVEDLYGTMRRSLVPATVPEPRAPVPAPAPSAAGPWAALDEDPPE